MCSWARKRISKLLLAYSEVDLSNDEALSSLPLPSILRLSINLPLVLNHVSAEFLLLLGP